MVAAIATGCHSDGAGTPGGQNGDPYGDSNGAGDEVDGPCSDFDHDGFVSTACAGEDCDDTDPTIYPGAYELMDDQKDNDCVGGDLTVSDAIGVFVETGGNDANPDAMAEPVASIGRGVALAQAAGKSVFIARGTYDENVQTTVSLYGGYEATGWTRHLFPYPTTC